MKKNRAVSYKRGSRRISVKISSPKPTICEACEGIFHGRRLNCHHWKYIHTLGDVKENPLLVLDNTAYFCIIHHRAADALRQLAEAILGKRLNAVQLRNIVDTMPDDMKKTFLRVLNASLALNL